MQRDPNFRGNKAAKVLGAILMVALWIGAMWLALFGLRG